MLPTTTLRPGFLVSLHTSITGNVNYSRRDIIAEQYTSDGKRYAQWETEKTVSDPREHELAEETRAKASNVIRSICAKSAHGLLCPELMASNLEQAIIEARETVNAFNATAKITRVSINILCGKIAADDVEAMRAINAEVRTLLDTMQDEVRDFDVEKIRAAAAKAKALDSMLTPAAQERIQAAVDAVRTAARRIVKAGETAALEVDRTALVKLREARTAFLDLDDVKDVQSPTVEARGLDLAPDAPEGAPAPVSRPAAPQFALEL